jgi:phenylpropionate dioxygenase-like ring-hydroxylating dioxygenase large terminal subunit
MELDTATESPLAGRAQLVPLGRGRASVVRLADDWFIAATARELRRAPLATSLFSTPIVLFRDAEGRAGALIDRCPHRNVPLSTGEVAPDGTLRCPYHGWRFDRAGSCRHIPSLVHPSDARARHALALPTLEQDGYIWVHTAPIRGDDASTGAPPMPTKTPHRFSLLGAPGYSTVRQVVEADATLYSTLENALDVPHTAFLHRGLFRSATRGIRIVAKVRRDGERVVAEYVGEPRPSGWVGRILSPSGGTVTHFDRFLLPSIAQVEYRIGDENHILVDAVMSPISDFKTRIYAVVSFRVRPPHWLVAPFLRPLALRIFAQDARILRQQTETISTFGGEQFASTEIDVLGRHIWRLLKARERGEVGGEAESAEITLEV